MLNSFQHLHYLITTKEEETLNQVQGDFLFLY